MWRYYLLRIGTVLAKHMPPKVAYWITWAAAKLAYRNAHTTRAAIEANLRRIVDQPLDDETSQRLVRSTLQNLYLNYWDLVRIPHFTREELRSRVEFYGMNYFDEATSHGKGVVLASAHLGNLDFVLQASLGLGLRFTVLAEQLEPKRLHDLQMQLRRTRGLTFEPVGPRGIRAAFEAIRRGDFACVATDRAIHGKGIVTDFLGEPAIMPTGAAELALRTGATVLPAYSIRTGVDSHRVYLEPPIRVEAAPGNADKVRALTDVIIAIMERYIKAHPDQWMAMEPVWVSDHSLAASALVNRQDESTPAGRNVATGTKTA